MLRVLLVDDEPFIIQGLSVLINWEQEGFEIVKTAENGTEAYEYLRDGGEVDLIIADIQMPGMTGLELLERINSEKLSSAYFVILSGYNDFSYAREALRNNCVDYILKPVEAAELVGILRKISNMSESDQSEKQHQEETEAAYFARNINALIAGKFDDIHLQYVKEHLSVLGGIRYVEIEAVMNEISEDEEGDIHKFRESLRQIFAEQLGLGYRYLVFEISRDSNDYEIGFIYGDNLAEERGMTCIEYLGYVQKVMEGALGKGIHLIAGKSVPDISAISKSYSTANILKSQEAFHEPKPVVIYESELSVNQNKAILCKQSADNLIRAIEQNDDVAIKKAVDSFYEDMSASGVVDSMNLNINYLLFQLIHMAAEQNDEVDQEEILHRISESSFGEGSSRGGRKHMLQFAMEYAEYLSQLRKNVSRGILQEVEMEIREHYMENLSLRELSNRLFINSSYLGQLFRKQYGVSFKDYLTDYRINEGAKMLLKSDEKIITIAEKVGYKDCDYFIDKFIERKGMTPSKYRKQAC